ncbi:hypothetical protein GRZ55_06990 [Chelativorans sp. ZYF759]|uniref:hypothetical protein n=1 Tax=Chelativorans sp. ZYF759 TaxID=2692213 RepID=UPI00145DC8F9|nr:hypothetical protein [Chelativorans sp. ZYF759]NMG38982.1 hypothetical protein [Chelativorans sp. ZYF759]
MKKAEARASLRSSPTVARTYQTTVTVSRDLFLNHCSGTYARLIGWLAWRSENQHKYVMRVTGVIQSRKSNVSLSEWSDDKLKAKDFSLSRKRGKPFPLTRRWRWQIITFAGQGRSYRLMVAYHTLVPEFIVALGEDVSSDCRILARWEFHASHPGWHVHSVCGDTDGLSVGIVKPLGTKRIPAARSYHRHKKMLNDGHAMSDTVATAIACSLVGIPHQPDMFVMDAMPWV